MASDSWFTEIDFQSNTAWEDHSVFDAAPGETTPQLIRMDYLGGSNAVGADNC